MFGCDLLFTLLIALVIPTRGGIAQRRSRIGHGRSILIWSIAVNGFILHRAMNITVFVGISFRLRYGARCRYTGKLRSNR